MSHCHDDHSSHSHDHGGHEHDHSDDITPALQTLLYKQIDFSALTCLNEATPRSGAAICQKTWAQRLEAEPELESDADEQLLMIVPFTGQVRLHSILLRTSTDASAPKTLHVHLNRDDLDFSTASDLQPTQTIELSQTSEVQELPIKRALFNTTRCLALFFPDNFGDGEDVTRISYLGFKGEFMKLNKEPVNFLYEAAANPADHKTIVGTREGMGSLGGAAGGRDAM
ncbi:hypothetical protein W97_00270 [Coniosporium apollinis CBS 100218]|uniref:PITH domain-containing protein n=1 Tax=Coniosporium apollinis (strain CBS 100218) TaxID=1168221 RepID=R7YGX3_CONA1|nr:uncharacterized protein W97_00270 [Coniosporium apollinis CBS 100218]EON61059.1 hypothetical protein W97_00270 [Coniosporium apollinis CBS 100218]